MILHRSSILAQKLVDEKTGPKIPHTSARMDPRRHDFNHFYNASSEFKGKEEGCINSFKAHRYYLKEACRKKKDLIDEMAVVKGQEFQ